MRTIAVYFDAPGFGDEPMDDPVYVSAYERLGRDIAEAGGRFAMVRGADTYRSGMTFSGGWLLENGRWARVDGALSCDVIFNKGVTLRPTPHANVVTSPAFDALCNDKAAVCALFPSLFPLSITVRNDAEKSAALARLPSAMAVLKPLDGWGGRDVFIGPKAEAERAAVPYPALVQEFIDTRGGIPGLVQGAHDFRILMLESEPLVTYAKIPAPGRLVANWTIGGRSQLIPVSDRPPEAMALVEPVDRALRDYPRRLYSIDCGRDVSGRWLLIELNAHPGMMTEEELGPEADGYFRRLARFLVDAASPGDPLSPGDAGR